MKNTIRIFLTIYFFAVFSVNASEKPIEYVVTNHPSKPNTLVVQTERSNQSSATQLVLRGPSMGVTKQVQNVTCDGHHMSEIKSGVWSIPPHCKKLQWEVPLLVNKPVFASAQQSIRVKNFVLFSELSSLPRLQDEKNSEILQISVADAKTIFPKPNAAGKIILPDNRSAPFFVLMNPTIIGAKSVGSITLNYYQDTSIRPSKLPDINSHLKGLQWLSAIVPNDRHKTLTLVWLGLSTENISLTGATGNGLLLANYPNDGEFPLGDAMLLYVALHEGFHQLTSNFPEKEPWISESLASYYGMRALQVASPKDKNTSALLARFLAGAEHYKSGLLSINNNVRKGNRSEYGAFYTKGIAFWMAVDKALLASGKGSLDSHLIEILKANKTNKENMDLQKILNLPAEIWITISKNFLK